MLRISGGRVATADVHVPPSAASAPRSHQSECLNTAAAQQYGFNCFHCSSVGRRDIWWQRLQESSSEEHRVGLSQESVRELETGKIQLHVSASEASAKPHRLDNSVVVLGSGIRRTRKPCRVPGTFVWKTQHREKVPQCRMKSPIRSKQQPRRPAQNQQEQPRSVTR